MTQAISENASENPTKPKRGRPPRFDPSDMASIISLFPELRTRRGQLNRMFEIRALQILREDPAFQWLCSTEEAINRGEGKIRASILVELGRVDDDETLWDFARKICELKPLAKDAIALIRRWRTGKDRSGGRSGRPGR